MTKAEPKKFNPYEMSILYKVYTERAGHPVSLKHTYVNASHLASKGFLRPTPFGTFVAVEERRKEVAKYLQNYNPTDCPDDSRKA